MGFKLHLIFLVVVGVAGSAYSSGCPGAGTVSPCYCMEMEDVTQVFCRKQDMSLIELKKVLTAFDKQYPLRLVLFYVNLGTVPTDFFEGFNIRVLVFAHCKFEQIPDVEGRILVGLENTLEELSVIDTIEKRNSPVVLDLSHLKKLKDLHFSYNTIPELSDNWFKKGPSSLTFLYFERNGIEKLGSNAFANLPNLKVLQLDGNRFGEIKRSVLPSPATHLEELKLNDNGLMDFPDNFLADMPALTRLSLQNNKFNIIRETLFSGIWIQLDYLDLLDNPLNCLDFLLEWMVKSSHTPRILGVCAKPPERKGKNILDIIKGNQ